MKMLNPMLDFVFKALFGKEDNISKKLLISLLNDIFVSAGEDRITSITYLNPFNYRDFMDDKLSILDIKAKTEKEELINVEVQVKNDYNYRKRILYYWSKIYGETIKKSEDYSALKKTISVNITDYNAIPESKKLHSSFKILEKGEYFPLTEDLQIHFLELPKLKQKGIKELSGIELWAEFLKEAGKEGSEKKIKELMERSDIMKDAVENLGKISEDDRMREIAWAREKARLDEISRIKYAERKATEQGMEKGMEKGMKEGMEKGLLLGKKKIAQNLLKLGFSPEKAAEAAELSIEEIMELKREIEK